MEPTKCSEWKWINFEELKEFKEPIFEPLNKLITLNYRLNNTES
jgi:hypothetical protein